MASNLKLDFWCYFALTVDLCHLSSSADLVNSRLDPFVQTRLFHVCFHVQVIRPYDAIRARNSIQLLRKFAMNTF